jgi:phospholipid/cholesterol/gamma-HCH transport system permease protein
VATVNIAQSEEADLIKLVFDGEWNMRKGIPSVSSTIGALKNQITRNSRVVFDLSGLKKWDTSFVNFALQLVKFFAESGLKFDAQCLSPEVMNIMKCVDAENISFSHNESPIPRKGFWRSLFERCETRALAILESVNFIGDLAIEFWRTCCGKLKFRSKEFLSTVEQAGVMALPIVALISFLVGLILAFVSIIQLNKFGAGIYCADLVGIAMMREMACLMTAVITSGRTGAAFAATIGTMVVNEEIDAMKTMGLSCFRFIVLPRVFAFTIMMPLLCIFSDIIGIYGGMFAAITMLDMNVSQYLTQTKFAISLSDVFCGLSKSVVFAILISSIGCLKGMQCGRDAEAVGKVTTSAVVTSITAVIVADAVFALIFNVLGI